MGLRDRAKRFKGGAARPAGRGLLARAATLRGGEGYRRSGLLARAVLLRDEKKNIEPQPDDLLSAGPPPDVDIATVREALDRKVLDLTNLFEIGKEINGTLNQEQLLATLLFSAMGQMGVEKIMACTRGEGGGYRLAGQKGLDGLDPSRVRFPAGGGLARHFAGNPHPADLALLARVADPEELEVLQQAGAVLVAPLINKQDLTGFLVLGERYGGMPYAPDDREFLATLASLAAISMENSRLFRSLEQKLNQLSALYDISRIINGTEDREQILDLIIETLATGFGISQAALFLCRGNTFSLARVMGMSTAAVLVPEIPVDQPEFAAVLAVGEAVIHENYRNRTGLAGVFAVEAASLLLVPLVAAGRQAGVLVLLGLKERPSFRKEDRELFSIIASQIAPPLLMAGMVEEARLAVRDPFSPFLEQFTAALTAAESFSLALGVVLVSVRGLPEWASMADGTVVVKFMEHLARVVRETVDPRYAVLRAGSAAVVVLLPGLPLEEQEALAGTLRKQATGLPLVHEAPDCVSVLADLAQLPDEYRDPASFIFQKGL